MSERATTMAEIETVFNLMQGQGQVIAADKLGDMAHERLDPYHRAPGAVAYNSTMYCRILARDYCAKHDIRARAAEAEAAAITAAVISAYTNPALFELQPSYPVGDGSGYVKRLEMSIAERGAFSDALGREIGTKSRHKAAFDKETEDLIAGGHFAEDGLPVHSERRVYGEQPPLI